MAIEEKHLKFFADYIRAELGIIYQEQNYYALETRLEQICKLQGFASTAELYSAGLKGITGDFRNLLLDIATNNETSFFRDPKVFLAVEKYVLPQLKAIHPKTTLFRVWSAACSFGQEPYSLAMMVEEFLHASPGHPRFEIFATDVADHALLRSKTGIFSQLEAQRGLPIQKLLKFFTKTEDSQWEVRPELRRLIRFEKANLLGTFAAFGQFHVIFCRHVLIYQDTEKKKEIIGKLAKSLTPGGFLILGGSESMLGYSEEFEMVPQEGAIIYRKK